MRFLVLGEPGILADIAAAQDALGQDALRAVGVGRIQDSTGLTADRAEAARRLQETWLDIRGSILDARAAGALDDGEYAIATDRHTKLLQMIGVVAASASSSGQAAGDALARAAATMRAAGLNVGPPQSGRDAAAQPIFDLGKAVKETLERLLASPITWVIGGGVALLLVVKLR